MGCARLLLAVSRRKRGQVIDGADARIIAHLSEDGRAPNVDIAKAVGLSETAVRRRLERLFRTNVVTVWGEVSPEALGFGVNVVLSLQVDMGQAEDVAQLLAKEPEVRYAALSLGDYGLVILACFRTHDEMTGFIASRVRSVPGVHRCQVYPLLKVLKSGTDWRPILDQVGQPSAAAKTQAARSRKVRKAKTPVGPAAGQPKARAPRRRGRRSPSQSRS